MGFGFSRDQETFRKEIRDFFLRDIKLRTEEAVLTECFPWDMWKQIGDHGLLGIGLPDEYGGRPGDCLLLGILAEELGRIELSLAFALLPSYGTSLAIHHGGARDQMKKWLPGLIGGDSLGSIGMTEPDCGSDLSQIRMRAVQEGDSYVFNGEKSYVSWGLVAHVNWIFVKTGKDNRTQEMTSFLIPLDLPGISKTPLSQMGLRSAGHSALIFEDVRAPKSCKIGKDGKALRLAAKVFPITRMLLSLSALGAAQSSLEEAISFARKRHVFGRPLGKFEGVSFQIAEDATNLEAVRWLCYRTLWLMEQGERCVKEIAMCKWRSTELALRVIHNTLLIYGHRGYSKQELLERRYRDIIGYEIAESTPQILKMTISEELLGKTMRPFC